MTYTIDAIDPLVLRDGRPNDGRSESRTLPFPLSSTVAGVVRTALGRRRGVFDATLRQSLVNNVEVRGPLLVAGSELLVPAPLDAVLLGNVDRLETLPLRPIHLPDGAGASPVGKGRSLVGLPADAPRTKPLAGAPRFWRWKAFEAWLQTASPRDDAATRELLTGALVALEREERIHVAIGSAGTAEDGMLFGTEGLRTAAAPFDLRTTQERKRAIEAGDTDGPPPLEVSLLVDVAVRDAALGTLPEGVRPFGGERRLSVWRCSNIALPAIPAWLARHVENGERPVVRVVLLTPAHVASSKGPAALDVPGVSTTFATRVDRPITISGWDMAARKPGGEPKPTRRLAAAGSVFWVRLEGPPAARRQWLDRVWMRNVSDDEQSARDGFGLAAVGIGSEA